MQQGELDFTRAVRNAHYHALTNRNKRRQQILDYLETVIDATNREIAKHLAVDACSITGRIMELRDLGRVSLAKTRECKVTGNRVCAWKIK